MTSLASKQNPIITELALFDVVPLVKGVAADVGHVDSPAVTKGYTKEDDGLKHALTGSEIVIIPAGVPRKVSCQINQIYFHQHFSTPRGSRRVVGYG